jgi:pre-rRNA-processing protein TSR3
VLHPPTIIVVHPRERRSKCSVEPLRRRVGFVFWTFPRRGPQPLDGYVRLGFGGPLLTPGDAPAGLLVLDATWKYAERMERDYASLPIRSLLPWQTAYPRTSKVFDDPSGGLATIEAIYAAFAQMGRDPRGLLDDYRWKDEFLALNAERLAELSPQASVRPPVGD